MIKSIPIKDAVYGVVKIDSPVIVQLLKSPSLKRLKKISQFGVPDEFYHLKSYSRFDHSLGVFLLLKKLGATEEEQIAGLLHDVSHTAFSHVIDYVVGTGEMEDYQDTHHKKYIRNSDLTLTLKAYGYNPERIADHHSFSLLDKDIPHICADRIDYALREFPLSVAKKCLNGLTVANNKIVFNNKKTAFLFSTYFLKRQMEQWGGFEAVVRYRMFAIALKEGLKNNIIHFNDFWKYDDYIIKKLKRSKNRKIQYILNLLRSKSLSHLPKSTRIFHKKFRWIDPEVKTKKGMMRLTMLSKEYKAFVEKKMKKSKKGIVVPVFLYNDESYEYLYKTDR